MGYLIAGIYLACFFLFGVSWLSAVLATVVVLIGLGGLGGSKKKR